MANINHFDFKNYRVFETEIAGRQLTVETGTMALPHPQSRATASTFSRSPLTSRSACTP